MINQSANEKLPLTVFGNDPQKSSQTISWWPKNFWEAEVKTGKSSSSQKNLTTKCPTPQNTAAMIKSCENALSKAKVDETLYGFAKLDFLSLWNALKNEGTHLKSENCNH